jgi:O-antigen/teichoic acid export membrane protein
VACLSNWRAFLVFGVMWTAIFLGTTLIITLIGGLIGDGDFAAMALLPAMLMLASMFFCSTFYSFKDMHMKKSVPFATLVLVALGIAAVNIDPPTVLFGLFVLYGLSGYVIYIWRKAKGQPASMISTSTDEPDERGLHQ